MTRPHQPPTRPGAPDTVEPEFCAADDGVSPRKPPRRLYGGTQGVVLDAACRSPLIEKRHQRIEPGAWPRGGEYRRDNAGLVVGDTAAAGSGVCTATLGPGLQFRHTAPADQRVGGPPQRRRSVRIAKIQ